MNTIIETNVRLIASPKSWIEGEALRQLYAAVRLDGMREAVGFPDLHQGKGVPVGAVFVTERVIYPHLIGGDIGCGMTLWKTDLLRRKAKLDRWAELRFDLEHPWEGNTGGWLQDNQLPSTEFDEAMGTIGGGNHFAELQAVERIHDAEAFAALGLDRDNLGVLVHSGSRGLGESVLWTYAAEHGATGTAPRSEAGAAYLRAHETARRWARANRELIVRRFLDTLGTEGEFVVIPGSRGSLSHLVKPIGDGESHGWSLAHGAGRKWARSESRLRMRERFRVTELAQTPLGGRVICEQRDLLYEEAPAAYKSIETVVQDLVAAGLVSVIATFRPLLTYKTRKLRR